MLNTIPKIERCSVCNLPDAFEDCNHHPLTPTELRLLFPGTINPYLILCEEDGKYVMVEAEII